MFLVALFVALDTEKAAKKESVAAFGAGNMPAETSCFAQSLCFGE
jgi:hypothetical protein